MHNDNEQSNKDFKKIQQIIKYLYTTSQKFLNSKIFNVF